MFKCESVWKCKRVNSKLDFCTERADLRAVGAKVTLHTPDYPPLRKPFSSVLLNLFLWLNLILTSGAVLHLHLGWFYFVINQTLQMIVKVLGWLMCPPFFCVWDPFWGPWGALKGPWRLQKSPKTAYLALITFNAPKWAEQGSNLVEHYRTHPGGYVKTI